MNLSRTIALLGIGLLLGGCKTTLPIVHYYPIGNNTFLQSGNIYLQHTSADSVHTACTFLSGTSTESVFYVHVENNSNQPLSIDPADFYLINGDSSLPTVLIGAIDPANKLAVIEEELAYYQTKTFKRDSPFQHNKSKQPRVDAKYQMKQLLEQKDYWRNHTLHKITIPPKQSISGDVVFTWTRGNKMSTLYLPVGKEVSKFAFAQDLVLP